MTAENERTTHGHTSASAVSEYFAPQPTPTAALPDPEPLLRNLTRGVLEVFAGTREVDQLARWLAEEPYHRLVVRANLAARARSARGAPAIRVAYTILSVHQSSPADGIVEATVIVRGPTRTRAVAMRLEGLDGRWRATSLALL
ncbi:Rv3235 family protein [Microbacterium fluvii]|uniref:Rv3235 family protein n=1 Tax=Microbacterium fluvii TaxID=415215 RepID=A0ABW2H917_9MICO|nr:Rv3235 family protein [Microbacterium fluvii]MCU4671472.1 Rv3235 family protein [Microbacterium fluvii]